LKKFKKEHVMMHRIGFILLVAVCLCACNKDIDKGGTTTPPGSARYAIDWAAAADSSTGSLLANYWNASSNYFNYSNSGDATFHYWPQAHALDVLTDAFLRTGNGSYRGYMNSWFAGVPQRNGGTFSNEFYDDMEWNALALLRAYAATDDARFKTAAEGLWTELKGGWNETMGGGISWRKAMPYYKNTPANAPAVILAARSYKLSANPADLDWSKKIFTWLRDSLYNAQTGWVYDGINSNNDGVKNTTWKFTYNQGTFIGAALELYQITNESRYLNDAVQAADFALTDPGITNLSDNLLRDEGGGDGGLFKGVFVRYFTQLVLTPGLPAAAKTRYVAFLKNNAEMLWYNGTDKRNVLFSTYWKNKPTAPTELTTQLSGATLVEAAALLKKEGLF
jgi:predicted alpha-1,6-mannanase (GH76 family)